VDGVVYSVGATLGDGIVAYAGSSPSFNQSSLNSCTDYFYRIYSYNRTASCVDYLTSAPLSGDALTLPQQATAQPTSLTFSSVTSSSMSVNYIAATGTPTGYLVLRKIGSDPATLPVDGTTYPLGSALGDATVAYVGAAATFNESGLSSCTDYHYRIFSYVQSGGCIDYLTSSPLSGNQSTQSQEPAAQATSLSFNDPEL
jgi:hypothetical protein